MYKDENCRWDVLKEYIHQLTLESMQDETEGDCSTVGLWAAKFDIPILGPKDEPDALHVKEAIQYCCPPGTPPVLNADELAALREQGAVYTVNDQGQKEVVWYDKVEYDSGVVIPRHQIDGQVKLDKDWDELAARLTPEDEEDEEDEEDKDEEDEEEDDNDSDLEGFESKINR